MRQEPHESLLSKIHRTVLVEAATAGAASGIDEMFKGATGEDVTGLAGANVGDGSVMHSGPAEGGDPLDRPSAGYLAHASVDSGVSVGEADGGMSSIARDINQAGTLEIDGQKIEVLDYIPGGDMLQMASGDVDPGQVLMKMAHHAMTQEGATQSANGASSINPQGYGNPAENANEALTNTEDAGEGAADRNNETGSSVVGAGRVPDADENARDLEALAFQHKLDVDTAIQTSDTAQVHTQLHAHGRTLEIDTDFEATKPDNSEERQDAAEHVQEVAGAVRDEVNRDEPNMHIRSRIAAHLDAVSKDEGMTI